MKIDQLYLWLACLALYFGIISFACLASAMSLSIMGHSSGQGLQNLSFAGDLLNVSILQNATAMDWNITAVNE